MQRTLTVDADQMKSAKHARVNHFVNGPHGLLRDHAQSPVVAVLNQGNEHARKRTLKTTSAQLLKTLKRVVKENETVISVLTLSNCKGLLSTLGKIWEFAD